MHRSLQVQILSWLAALATLGAATHPTFDTILFATAFVVGTLMMHVRERLEHPETRRAQRVGHFIGRLLGASAAWAVVVVRHWTSLGQRFPARLSAPMLVAAAVIPTGIVVVEGVQMLLARGKKIPAAREEG